MGRDTTKLDRPPRCFQTRGSSQEEEERGDTDLVDCVFKLESKLVSKLERISRDVYQQGTHKLDAIQV